MNLSIWLKETGCDLRTLCEEVQDHGAPCSVALLKKHVEVGEGIKNIQTVMAIHYSTNKLVSYESLAAWTPGHTRKKRIIKSQATIERERACAEEEINSILGEPE